MNCFFEIDRQARMDFISIHNYTFMEQKIPTFNPKRRAKLKRKTLIKIYTQCFNIDSIYEYFLFREVISRINDCFYPGERRKPVATLGHWIPLSKGGHHCVDNWIIQSTIENNALSDYVPLEEKWSFNTQIKKIEQMLKNPIKPENVEKVRELYPLLAEVFND